jgi:ribosomal protein S18 acetylase RimI-like enzyme
MLSIRNLTEADLVIADIIIRAAYQTSSSRIEVMRKNLYIQPHGWLLATLADEPVGLVGATNYGTFAYVGLMSVLPTVQRQGVGRALLSHLLNRLADERCSTVLLDASESGAALYRHFAFVDEDIVGHWSLDSRSALKIPLLDQGYVQLLAYTQLAELAAFDARYFGADRLTALTVLWQAYPGCTLVTRNQVGDITGYLFVQGQTLGPWVAEQASDAEALLMQALAFFTIETPLVFVPGANTLASKLLERSGFRLLRTLRHMRRGDPVALRDRTKIYGQVSLALG